MTIGIIAIRSLRFSGAVNEPHHIALQICDVIIGNRAGRAVGVGQRIGGSLGVVGKIQNLRCDSSVCSSCGNRLPQKPSPGVDIAVFLRDGGFQNTFTAAAGGGRLILQTIIRGINGDNSCFVAISTTGTSEIGILDIFADLNVIVSQLRYGVILITVPAGAFVKGIAILRAGGSHDGFYIAVGMVCVSISAAGAGIGFQTTFHIVVAQSRRFIRSVALATGAFVEGIAALGAGGCDYRGDIIVNRNRLIGLGDSGFLRPAAVQIIGVRSGSRPLIQQENPTVSEGILKIRLSVLPLLPPRQEVLLRFRAIGCVCALCIQSRRATW